MLGGSLGHRGQRVLGWTGLGSVCLLGPLVLPHASLLVPRTTASTKKLPSRPPWLCPSLRTEAQPSRLPCWGRRHTPASRDRALALLPWHLHRSAPHRAKWNFTQGELVSEPPGLGSWLAGPLSSSRATGSWPAAVLGPRCFKGQVLAAGLEPLSAFPSLDVCVWRRIRCPKLCPAGPRLPAHPVPSFASTVSIWYWLL